MSFTIWSPAILPMAASCTSMASSLAASMPGMAFTLALPMMMASHCTCPRQAHSPMTSGLNTCTESSWATEREITCTEEPSPLSSTFMLEMAVWLPWVSSFSVSTSLASAPSSALVSRTVEVTPRSCTISISQEEPSSMYTLVVGFRMRSPVPSPSP